MGDRVSILYTAWGEEYAKSINSRSWKTIRYEGTVLRKDGRKWVVNFDEPDGEYSSWKPTDLRFVSRVMVGGNGRADSVSCDVQ